MWVAGPAAGGIPGRLGRRTSSRSSRRPATRRASSAACSASRVDPSPPFDMDNRGKRSVRRSTARRTTAGLIGARIAQPAHDASITNVRPGGSRRVGSGLRDGWPAVNPRLVYGLITGYGETGPDADRRRPTTSRRSGHVAGVAHLLTRPGRHPAVPAGRHGRRHMAGMTLVAAVLCRSCGGRAPATVSWSSTVAVPPRRLHRELRPQHVPADAAIPSRWDSARPCPTRA